MHAYIGYTNSTFIDNCTYNHIGQGVTQDTVTTHLSIDFKHRTDPNEVHIIQIQTSTGGSRRQDKQTNKHRQDHVIMELLTLVASSHI